MEIKRIARDRLLITLTEGDMRLYGLPPTLAECGGDEIRRRLRPILEEAGYRTGFEAAQGRIAVEMRRTEGGGCRLEVRETREREGEALFRTDGTEQMLMLCRRLAASRPADMTILYGGGQWFVRFGERCPYYIGDYARRLDGDAEAWLREHGRVLYRGEDLPRLAAVPLPPGDGR